VAISVTDIINGDGPTGVNILASPINSIRRSNLSEQAVYHLLYTWRSPVQIREQPEPRRDCIVPSESRGQSQQRQRYHPENRLRICNAESPCPTDFEVKAEREGPAGNMTERSIEFELEWDENDGQEGGGSGQLEIE